MPAQRKRQVLCRNRKASPVDDAPATVNHIMVPGAPINSNRRVSTRHLQHDTVLEFFIDVAGQ